MEKKTGIRLVLIFSFESSEFQERYSISFETVLFLIIFFGISANLEEQCSSTTGLGKDTKVGISCKNFSLEKNVCRVLRHSDTAMSLHLEHIIS